MTRLPVTGHRIPLVRQGTGGFSFVVGGDVAWVANRLYLPSSLGHELTPLRTRLRAGIHYEREGQFVGALHLGLRF